MGTRGKGANGGMITAFLISLGLKGGEGMEGKLAGLGLKNILILTIIIWILTVVTKTVLTKHPINGVTEIIQAV
jgi:hypothetical protein